MEKLVTLQEQLMNNLKTAERNYKKTPKERIKRPYLETRLEVLELQYTEFKEGHKLIISAASKDKKEAYFTEGYYEQFEELYVQYKTCLREALEPFMTPPFSQSPIATGAINNENSFSDVKLPRITLPTFGGKYEEWQTFYDMFLSLIHNNKAITSVQKLHYLKSNLSGEAMNLLRNFSTTEANYEEAWKQLVKRYHNKRYNCNAIMNNLIGLKKIHSESANSIKHLLDTTSTCLKSLQSIGIRTETWDEIIVYLTVAKLDSESIKQWEQYLNTLSSDGLPTWSQLKDYLEYRFRSLEMIDSTTQRSTQAGKPAQKPKTFHTSVDNKSKSNDVDCAMCQEKHYIYHCKRFGLMTPKERQEFVQNKKLCFNCLSPTHAVIKCRQSMNCRKCGRRHHTLLHFERERTENAIQASEVTKSPSDQHEKASTPRGDTHITTTFTREELQPARVLLATARLKVFNSHGYKKCIRALLDQGSQASLVTEATVQLLGLKRIPVNGFVSGLGDGHSRIKHRVSLQVESRHNPANYIHVNAYVMHSLTSMLPTANLKTHEWVEINNLPLADPTYATPGKIDILLGTEVYGNILLDGIVRQSQGSLIAQNTLFGWIISGKVSRESYSSVESNLTSMHVHLEEADLLKQFWELENEPNIIKKEMTGHEKVCEDLFDLTTVRDDSGRFIVRLPFTTDDPKCQYGQSKQRAIKMLESLERRLSRDPQLSIEYSKVLDEYLCLNHMIEVNEKEIGNPRAVYLPHHAVVREDKDTTKVRVVFNASSKGNNNVSLNDDLLVGPKLQQDLRHILMRWRNHKIGLVADITKFYRMVRVAEEDTDFQRIVWRFNPSEAIRHYKLVRLTFGTACAPYLAVKSLQRLAELENHKYPLAAKITKLDYYMDDLMSGAETITEALQIYHEMNELMKLGGFELQKWNSNSETFLNHIGKSGEQYSDQNTPIKVNNSIKVLGVSWCRKSDYFEYVLNLPDTKEEPVTKRQILSVIARLYDPLGWIAPVVVVAKIFIQRLWKSGLEWDDCLTEDLLRQWLTYKNHLIDLKELTIPRWLNVTRASKTELHVFSDASQAAYSAAVYIRVTDESNEVHVNLVTAKTKVAPIDKEVSIPRLELCGSTLAAKLIFEVSQVMEIPKKDLYGWTDSTVVLAWLKGGSSRWATFVSNRVSTILNILDYEQWGHVSTDVNPADCASRGLQPRDLKNHPLWWKGPQWLADKNVQKVNTEVIDTHEEEKIKSLIVSSNINELCVWLRFSSLSRLLKVISYCRRILTLKLPKTERPNLPKFITANELSDTLMALIKLIQEREFVVEIKQLKTRGCVSKRSSLRTLCPFLDQKGIIRVSGRIAHAEACYDTRHPIIMPAKHHFTMLIINDAHLKTLHGGPQVMLNLLRTKYWILRAKERVKKCFRECVVCLRYSTKKSVPLMGSLPEARVQPSKPFKSTGVDYCGPVSIRFSPGRGSKSYKGYICLFVCMVTRAVHLEAVTDLTAKGFIAAFKRFTARRGHCQNLYSDNGTNFVGADKQMREMFNSAKSALPKEIAELLTLERTTWHFIPPHAPNFGGLWEAGVRSTKTHLRKVVGNATLTYEEIATVLAQVEACLNSRPLTLLSDNLNDPLPLTPGHFLVGEPLINIADEDYSKSNVIGLDRWRLTQKIVNDFWSR